MRPNMVQFLAVSVTLSEDSAPRLRREVLPLKLGYARIDLETARSTCHVVVDKTSDAVVLSTAGVGEAEVELDFFVPVGTQDAPTSDRPPMPSAFAWAPEPTLFVLKDFERDETQCVRDDDPLPPRLDRARPRQSGLSEHTRPVSHLWEIEPIAPLPLNHRDVVVGAIETWCISEDPRLRTEILDGSGRTMAPSPSGRTPISGPIPLPRGRYLLRMTRSFGLSVVRIACMPRSDHDLLDFGAPNRRS